MIAAAGISRGTLAKMGRGERIALEVIEDMYCAVPHGCHVEIPPKAPGPGSQARVRAWLIYCYVDLSRFV